MRVLQAAVWRSYMPPTQAGTGCLLSRPTWAACRTRGDLHGERRVDTLSTTSHDIDMQLWRYSPLTYRRLTTSLSAANDCVAQTSPFPHPHPGVRRVSASVSAARVTQSFHNTASAVSGAGSYSWPGSYS